MDSKGREMTPQTSLNPFFKNPLLRFALLPAIVHSAIVLLVAENRPLKNSKAQ